MLESKTRCDINATDGYGNETYILLNNHYDIVCRGVEDALSYKYGGKDSGIINITRWQ